MPTIESGSRLGVGTPPDAFARPMTLATLGLYTTSFTACMSMPNVSRNFEVMT
jgi:hypothetical protein